MDFTLQIKSLLPVSICAFLLSCASFHKDYRVIRIAEENNMNIQGMGWYRVDNETMAFSGTIMDGSYDKFLSILTPETKRIIVNSGGGSVYDAVKIGMEIQRKRLEVTVSGYCLSSCANYFLTAASHVYMKDAFIGFHGNINSCVELYGGVDKYVMKDLPQNEPVATLVKIKKDVISAMNAEKHFYHKLGLRPDYLIDACRADKGKLNNMEYAFIAPSNDNMWIYGIKKVDGEQSMTRIDEFESYHNAVILQND